MPRNQQCEEVRILRFFEDAPLEKAELLFELVKDRMRTRHVTVKAPAPARKDRSATAATDMKPEQVPRSP